MWAGRRFALEGSALYTSLRPAQIVARPIVLPAIVFLQLRHTLLSFRRLCLHQRRKRMTSANQAVRRDIIPESGTVVETSFQLNP